MNPVTELNAIIDRSTVMYRKGDPVTEKVIGTHPDNLIHVTEVFAFPETPKNDEVVDMHFVNVGITESPVSKEGFWEAIHKALGHGEFFTMTADKLKDGPSYITIGAWLGSQDQALRYIALGKLLGLWEPITPASVGVQDPTAADRMAGAGFVLASPFDPFKPITL